MKEIVFKFDDNQLNRVTTAIENAAKEMEAAKNAMDKLIAVKKPKWYQFWKWEFWQNWENVKPGYSRNQPIIDRTTTPPR